MLSFPKYENYQSTEEDWLGDIPQHWQFLRTKSIFRLVAEPAPKNNDEELLSVYSDIGVKPRRELEERGNKASTTDGYWLVKKGDIIVNKLLAWMGAIGLSDLLNPINNTGMMYSLNSLNCSKTHPIHIH
jgi:type I restriction enzyme, S subunit